MFDYIVRLLMNRYKKIDLIEVRVRHIYNELILE